MENNEVIVAPKKARKKNYINNREFFEAICKWQDEIEIDKNARMSEYLGECFMVLADRLARKASHHTHIEDMKSHAVLTCCLYAKNFDRTQSENPFAYFTQCIKNGFAQVHNKEKKLIEAKFQMIKEMCGADEYDYNDYLSEE